MTNFSGWAYGKQTRKPRLQCTCQAIRASSWRGKSTSAVGQAWRSELYRGGRAWGGRSPYMEYFEKHAFLGGDGTTRVWQRLPWCWHRWAFYTDSHPAGGVVCQDPHDLQVCSLDTHTKNRHATRDDVGCYSLGNLQAMLLKPVCNTWSCHLNREHYNTRSRYWNCVYRWVAEVPAGVLHSAPLCLFAASYPVASEEYCSSWLESVGERPFWCCALRASGGSWRIHCQLPYTQTTLSIHQQNSRDVFHRTWRSREPVYPPLWALTKHQIAHYYPRVSLLTCVSHHQSTVCINV